MLVFSRKVNESVVINGNIVVMVTEIDQGRVKLGIMAPKEVKVLRKEIAGKKERT